MRGWIGLGRRTFLALAVAGPARGQSPSVPVAEAPLAWRRYAAEMQATLTALMTGDTDAAGRFRVAIANGALIDDGLRVRLWIAPDGRVARVETPADPAIAEPLRDLLGTGPPAPPPPDMRWPITLLLRFEPETPRQGG